MHASQPHPSLGGGSSESAFEVAEAVELRCEEVGCEPSRARRHMPHFRAVAAFANVQTTHSHGPRGAFRDDEDDPLDSRSPR